jgi:formate dehydrogenase major subunit
MVNITIDGKKIQVPEGTTVLEAARQADIHIPTLCDHPHLTPYGGCRLCLVEVEGARTLQTSCTLPVSEGMVVKSDTDTVHQSRKFVLTLIFSERNHFCPYCQVSGGDCELQNSAYGEGMDHWPLQPNWKSFEVDASHQYFVLDQNRCILCRRCVRACGELVGNFTLGIEERGANSMLIADTGVPLGESSCISCGTCTQVCPTGALIDRWSAYRGHEEDVQSTNSICTACSMGCGIEVQTRNNQLVRILGDWDAEVNNGILCDMGRFVPMTENTERLVTPLVRKDGKLKAATWEEALATIADNMKDKANATAALASTRMSVEALTAFKGIFADNLNCSVVSTTEEGAATAMPAAIADEKGTFEGSLEDLKNAECVVVVGTDLTENHKVASAFIKRNTAKGTKLVIVDKKANGLKDYAHYPMIANEGCRKDILKGIATAILKLGLTSEKASGNPDEELKAIAEKTGLATDLFLDAAYVIAGSAKPVFVFGNGISKSDKMFDALYDLFTLLKKNDKSEPVILNIKGQANSLAASQLRLEAQFDVDGKEVFFLAMGDEHPTQKLIKSVESKKFLAVQSSYINQLTAMADVVLPVANWAEQGGHFLNVDGRLQEAVAALKPANDVKSNAEALTGLAAKFGVAVDAEAWKDAVASRVSTVAISGN